MNSQNFLTFKAIPSNKSALAATLAYTKTYDNFYTTGQLFTGVEKEKFEKIIGKQMRDEIENLSNKDYLSSSIDKIKNNAAAIDVLKNMKEMDPSPFMENICESIDKGLIDFTSKNIKNNDYVLVFTLEYAAVLYLMRNEVTKDREDEIRIIGKNLFDKFKENSDLMSKFLNEIDTRKESDYFKEIWMKSLDGFLKESLKTYDEKDVIRALIESGYGEFVRL